MSGGILLGVALLHILPETGETINEKCNGYPTSYCITFVGIILMVLMINVAHNHSHNFDDECHHDHDHDHEDDTHDHNHEGDENSSSNELLQDVQPMKRETNWASIFMLFIGLFIHDVSEGFALGFTQELMPAVYLFIGIALHKWCDVSCQAISGIKKGVSIK